ncbi:MAG: DNA mismatch repair endonuclease MutL [Phycisphaeraceae bacterium]|nr:DNA mismatch repair endonuclease MutL [Phycisphaeraceae bacterium]
MAGTEAMARLGAQRRTIRALPALLVNQIAAGEVIERPASVVKELLENALDAGATRINVELDGGGTELIRVTDDGSGIEPDELPLALAPHATSKIAASDDLDRIATMGFRGEALASIASVARVQLRSRTRNRDAAAIVEAEGDQIGPVRPGAGPVGTSVTVRNLFFNTPARRKFLRTPATEQQRCLEWVRDLAMARPAVGFRATVEGRVVLDLAPEQGPRDRVLAVLGEDLSDQMVVVEADSFDDARGVALWGLVGLPALARATPSHQKVFLNGRVVRDKTIQHAIREAYRGLVEPGRHPTAVLMLEMSPSAVDVNVHPAKLEVRFRDSGMVHQAVLGSIRRGLQRADLTPSVGAQGAGAGSLQRSPMAGRLPGAGWSLRPGGNDVSAERFAAFLREGNAAPRYDDLRGVLDADAAADRAAHASEPVAAPINGTGASPRPDVEATPLPLPTKAASLLQVHKSFVVAEDPEGVVIVDQHALHERVMFERLLERVSRGPLEGQRLLTPAMVAIRDGQAALVEALGPLLERIGMDVTLAGPRDVAVHVFPSLLFERGVEAGEFLRGLLDKAEGESFTPTSEEALRDVLDMMACKAAVKAGDALSEGELRDLLAMRETVERSSNCPHGRPTSIRLTVRELERLFGRT